MHDIALIGAGRIGRIHAANVGQTAGLRLKYVVDPVEAAARAVAKASGARVAMLEEVLGDEAVRGIVVASSTDTHLDYSLRAISAGKAVFCEKPIDLDMARVRAARAQLAAPAARFFLGFNRRFDPNFRALHARLRSGKMGKLETLHIISHDPAPPPIDYVRVSGGLFRDMAIHDFDMARWLLGEEPVEVFAAADALIDPAIGAAGDVDTAKILLRTASGRICLISNSRRSGYGYDQRIEAFCSGGLIRAGNVSAGTVELWTEEGPQKQPFQNFFLDRYAAAYQAEMQHFAEIIEGVAEPSISFDDGAAALALANAALESSRAGRVAVLAEHG
jgi:myo-inositol 2-dehydrogenase/D-chiro-inositol 1-dehydrogenase